MITSKDVRNKRFEKAAFGYKQEEIDEFFAQLEAELDEMERERAEANNKIQVLADKVREYMRDEDALKDALLGAQKQGHLVIADAQEKADQIMAEAQEKAAALEDEAVRQHAIKMEQNRAEIAKEKEALIEAQRQVADFKKSLFDMYKSHLELISSMPETVDEETEAEEAAPAETADEVAAAVTGEAAEETAAEIAPAVEKSIEATAEIPVTEIEETIVSE
ncbi:MAG: DivIVA domain-containing protein [Ruminococcus sp.]|nr:DivIVA domain-containing protein [Ruminococcus sp.]MBP3267693.1 DivIVA domain-containing protein [Ruminococcus sp.]MBP7185957.1 DivIVA domain-containing protein [Ruminococcus sp.]